MDTQIGYPNKAKASPIIGYYLIYYYNWHRPHSYNNGLPPGVAENQLKIMSEIS